MKRGRKPRNTRQITLRIDQKEEEYLLKNWGATPQKAIHNLVRETYQKEIEKILSAEWVEH